ncbi:activating transcription factor 6 beta [Homo sapiens]|uniref:ATF6B n=2 Tax=Homo sapiens TaxID=9606 RepID=A0A1U9X796_HUMAN|nr:cyclic AMP-dependent transcription factor ATF-6 beta isoform b [Homo sapiens]AAB47487.1 cAMP response element binding protein-related protein [Homo sapiens]AQY76661.1 ATF6B [Homo sapiens]AQY76662.1 ATF6B [Homo sapiens]AQY76664.1 ATF6B [Homo sapiens]EAX03581.1 cAMP responsive element binding protein-like 1, isoform CRA_a [Homo sapiens]|eukprot:NP_001129625.1 cyclic AMP-dependent transcription factor ATF-6 beta isoform b [Homo sapiens]
MAELMLLSEIADPTRFFTDNLLSPEDWDSTLYSGLDEVAEEQTQLFRCPEQDVPFDGSSLDVGMDVSPSEPPWELLPIFPDLQVKSEPSSPCSSSSLSSESSRLSTEPSSEALGVGEVLHVKTESLAPPLCLLGDDPTSSFETVQINVIPTSDDSSDVQTKIEPVSPCSSVNSEASLLSADSSSQAFIGEEVLEVKTESLSPSGCLLWDVPAPSLGAVQISMGPSLDGSSGKALPTRKPPLQPKPVVLTTVPMPSRAVPPSTTVLLQSLVQPPPVSPVVLIQGAIRVQPEGPAPSLPRPERKSIVPAPMPGNSCPPEVDAKLLKRQQRMIKNRESACQSRRKKKEYLQGLEARLQAVLADNQQLRRENAALRRRLEALLAENSELKLGSGNRKVVCIMVFLLFIAFNFGPVSISEPPSAPISPRMNKGEPQPRRHLLGFSEQEPVQGVEPLQGSSQGPKEPQPSPTDQPSFSNLTAFPGGAKELLLRDLDQLFLSSDCRHFNRTESLRLADELSGWVQRHQRGRRKIPQRAQERQKSQPRKKSPPVKAVPIQPPGPPERDSVGQLQLYRHPDRSQPAFLDAIDRREDTFYVVSFRRDHLLLPAISHNKTSRPKMSLVMPAMAPNETLSGRGAPGDYEEMMQIECEVMDTRVIHIKTSTVPPSLRKQPSPTPGNATGGPLPVSAASQAHQASHQPLYLNHP